MKIIVKKSLKKLLVYKNGEIIEEMKIYLGKITTNQLQISKTTPLT